MGDTSLVTVSCDRKKVGHGLTNAVFNRDVFCILLEHIAETYLEFHKLRHYMNVCRFFRAILKKHAYKTISLDEPKYSYALSCAQYTRFLQRNKEIYGSFLQMLREHSEVVPLVRNLGLCSVHADSELIDMQYEIMRQCSPHITDLRLKIQEIYKAKELWSVLPAVNPISISFRGNTLDAECGPKKSTWNIMDIFVSVQGCSRLRHLEFTLDCMRAIPTASVQDDLDLELPIESLCIHNVDWYQEDLISLQTVRLPNLKVFKGYVELDDHDGVETSRAAFRNCLTRHWVDTIEELNLTSFRKKYYAPDCCYIFDQVPNDELPKLKKLSITVDLLHPRSLVALSTLEEVCYSNARLFDLKELTLSLRESLESSRIPLPSLKKLELACCTSERGALEYLDYIYSIFDTRKVTLRTTSVFNQAFPGIG